MALTASDVSGPKHCAKCGDRLVFAAMDDAFICANPLCRKAVDWSNGPTAPGPVRLPTRDELLADSRRGHWQPLPPPPGETVLITREVRPGCGKWLLARYDPDASGDSLFIYGLPATHWAKDTLGTP